MLAESSVSKFVIPKYHPTVTYSSTGLLAGFSLLSLIELVYFFILCPIIAWTEKSLRKLSCRTRKVRPSNKVTNERSVSKSKFLIGFFQAYSVVSFSYAASETSKIAK